MENKVEDHPRSVKSSSNKTDRVIEPICNANVKHSMLNANSELTHATCNECMFDAIHDLCVLDFVNDVSVRSKSKFAKSSKKKKIWKPTGKVYTDIGYRWKRIGRTFTLFGNACPLTRFTFTRVVPLKETTSKLVITQNPAIKVVQIVLWYLDSGCSKHMTGNRSQLINFGHKFFGTVRFGNNQIAKIMGYGDYQMGNVMISQVYYVEGLGHNLFSVSQFCDSNVEVGDPKANDWLLGRVTYLRAQIDLREVVKEIGRPRFMMRASPLSSHKTSTSSTPQASSLAINRGLLIMEVLGED
ncbi:hypothetical protein Tco_0405183 [Tanacetum coccineum]